MFQRVQNELFEDKPKLPASPAAREVRKTELCAPHIARLTDFVEGLRAKMKLNDEIPFFDPWDGGTDAEVLFLAEAPGPKAVKSGFISRNNPDESAKNFFELNDESGISRKRTIIWNIVPWYIGSGSRIHAATEDDIEAGIRALKLLLSLLPKLRVIVLVGQKAKRGSNQITRWCPDVKIFFMWHPSPQCLNRYPNKRSQISVVLREVASYLDTSP